MATITGTTGADTLTGTDLNDTLNAGAGDDTLNGGAGNDTLNGEIGNDTLSGGTGDNTITGNEGIDTVSYSWVLTAGANNLGVVVDLMILYQQFTNVSNDTITQVENLTGSKFNDTLYGDDNNNVINGGLGADVMTGRAGNDTYVVDNIDDQVIELANEGTDKVQSSITYTLGANVENLTLSGSANIDGTGNELDNVITGNTGSNHLYGMEGNDSLNGGTGDDFL